jgi:hypothetical protein
MWIQTYEGVQFDPDDFTIDDIHLKDIAHALSNMCRFNGHCTEFYSVAQHSVLVSKVAETLGGLRAAQWGLFHDAAEAYVGDIPTPLKTDTNRQREAAIMVGIAEKFELADLDHPLCSHIKAVVKHSDLVLMATEKRDLMSDDVHWPRLDGIEPMEWHITPFLPVAAVTHFHKRYRELFE